jgi:hypothetical protein
MRSYVVRRVMLVRVRRVVKEFQVVESHDHSWTYVFSVCMGCDTVYGDRVEVISTGGVGGAVGCVRCMRRARGTIVDV